METTTPSANQAWQVFDLVEIATAFSDSPAEYREFLNAPSLSCGLYRLKAGATDMQARASLKVGEILKHNYPRHIDDTADQAIRKRFSILLPRQTMQG